MKNMISFMTKSAVCNRSVLKTNLHFRLRPCGFWLRRAALAAVLLFNLLFLSGWAQNAPMIDWYRISAGGGSSSNANAAILGTIGQAETGFMRVENVAIQGGYWSFAALAPPNSTTITWTNLARGNWSVAANWSPNQVPGPWDNVNITQVGSEVIVDADATVESLTLSNQNKVDGPGKLTITGPLIWLSGWIRGTVQCNGGLLGDGGKAYGSYKYLQGGCLINVGTLTNSSPQGYFLYAYTDSVISNLVGATVDWTTDTHIIGWPQPGGKGTFYNAGVFRKSGGTSVSQVQDVFINSGVVEARSGLLHFTQPYTQSDGVTRLLEGKLQVDQGLALNGGLLTGTNLLIGDVLSGNLIDSGGTVSPGVAFGSPGWLTINGNYRQTNNGTLHIELGGTVAGTGYSRLTVSSRADLPGILGVSLVNGFTPPAGSSYSFLTAGTLAGYFSTTNLPPNLPGLELAYNAHGAMLNASPFVPTRPELSIHVALASSGGGGGGGTVNSFTLSWPSLLAGVRLEESADLSSLGWTPVGAAAVDDGTTTTVNLPVSSSGMKFYRLLHVSP